MGNNMRAEVSLRGVDALQSSCHFIDCVYLTFRGCSLPALEDFQTLPVLFVYHNSKTRSPTPSPFQELRLELHMEASPQRVSIPPTVFDMSEPLLLRLLTFPGVTAGALHGNRHTAGCPAGRVPHEGAASDTFTDFSRCYGWSVSVIMLIQLQANKDGG